MQLNKPLTFLLGAGSIVLLMVSIVVMPWIVSQIPEDYFLNQRRERIKFSNPIFYLVVMVLKNTLGLVLLLLGIIMLFLPGPGILIILVGVVLINFPGKYKLEQWLISRQSILKAINWLRAKRSQPPLLIDKKI